jgi:predicted homoserine dehydrogenase-like protein
VFIVDRELRKLQEAGTPIRVGMIGAGFMAVGIARQMLCYTVGMKLVAIANRHLEAARKAYNDSGAREVVVANSAAEVDECITSNHYAITSNPEHICDASGVDIVVEVTGTVEYAAHVVLRAISRRKHVVLMNAELDGTIGPILKIYASRAGVILTNTEGDQPGVILNLYRWVRGLGIRPVLCGNIKGLHDPYRNPTTQEGFAKKWGMKAPMVTSFADGTKISFENAIVANATGMRVAKRGMYGPVVKSGTPIQEAVNWYPLTELVSGPGIVDYCVGAMPNPGVFVLGTTDDSVERHYLSLYKMGDGPLYCFYWPYHLCHFEVPTTVARAAVFNDAAIEPVGAPKVDVIALAKRELKAGEILDGLGQYMTYGVCENADVVYRDQLLPIGLSEGCRLRRDVARDEVLAYQDVELPSARLADKLREEQDSFFFGRQMQTSAA